MWMPPPSDGSTYRSVPSWHIAMPPGGGVHSIVDKADRATRRRAGKARREGGSSATGPRSNTERSGPARMHRRSNAARVLSAGCQSPWTSPHEHRGAGPSPHCRSVDSTGYSVLSLFPASLARGDRRNKVETRGSQNEMPNIKSAKKRMVLSRTARSRNRITRSRIRTAVRRVREADSREQADEHRRAAVALIDRAATRRVLHPNKAGRIKSQLDRIVRELA